MHSFKAVLNLDEFRVLVWLNQEDCNLICRFQFQKKLALFCCGRVKNNLVKTDIVAEIETVFQLVRAGHFYHIGDRKRPCPIPFGVVDIKHSEHIFQALAVDFALKNTVVNTAVNDRRSGFCHRLIV